MLYDEREYLFFERRIAVKKKVTTRKEVRSKFLSRLRKDGWGE